MRVAFKIFLVPGLLGHASILGSTLLACTRALRCPDMVDPRSSARHLWRRQPVMRPWSRLVFYCNRFGLACGSPRTPFLRHVRVKTRRFPCWIHWLVVWRPMSKRSSVRKFVPLPLLLRGRVPPDAQPIAGTSGAGHPRGFGSLRVRGSARSTPERGRLEVSSPETFDELLRHFPRLHFHFGGMLPAYESLFRLMHRSSWLTANVAGAGQAASVGCGAGAGHGRRSWSKAVLRLRIPQPRPHHGSGTIVGPQCLGMPRTRIAFAPFGFAAGDC